MPAERKVSHSRHRSRQRQRQFPSSCPPAAASCFLLTPWPLPPSRSHPHFWARTSSATIAAPSEVPARASGHRVPESTARHPRSVSSPWLPPGLSRCDSTFRLYVSASAFFALHDPRTVRQRNKRIPRSDANRSLSCPHLSRKPLSCYDFGVIPERH